MTTIIYFITLRFELSHYICILIITKYKFFHIIIFINVNYRDVCIYSQKTIKNEKELTISFI